MHDFYAICCYLYLLCILFFADPLYNAGGFFYPGQFPNFDPGFDMFKQIQAQIEAQHQA